MNTVNAAISFDDLPVGAIIAWASADIPNDWQLADGTGITLDLRDRFVYGAAEDGDVGDEGGGTEHTHVSSETGNGGDHSHDSGTFALGDDTSASVQGPIGSNEGVARSGHGHSVNSAVSTTSGNNHSHTLPALENATNLPRRIKLYFIEKTA